MADPVLTELAKTLMQQGPLFAVLVAIIVTGFSAKWVPGFAYKQMKNERDEALARVDRLVEVQADQGRLMAEMARKLDRIEERQLDRRRA